MYVGGALLALLAGQGPSLERLVFRVVQPVAPWLLFVRDEVGGIGGQPVLKACSMQNAELTRAQPTPILCWQGQQDGGIGQELQSADVGQVLGVSGTVYTAAQVVLVPDATHRQRDDLYLTTETDETGHYRIQGIPPGDYSLFCREDIEDGVWRDADFIGRNGAYGKSIHISENSRETLDLISIPFAF